MSVGTNIKKRRYELKLSQQELADAMGYKTRSTIAKIESGENDVSQKKLRKFADVLDTTVEALISGNAVRRTEPLFTESVPGSCKKVAIILAGGKSGANRQNIPSQFLNVRGKPIIVYCMEAYQNHPSVDDIYVVCVKGWESIVRDYAKQYGITKLRGLVPAGNSGTMSLKNGIDHIRPHYRQEDLVIIQEATRPMVTAETISRLLQAAMEKGSATICHSMKDYVQFNVSTGRAEYVDRDAVIALQSPEAHSLQLLTRVFDKARQENHVLAESCCTMLLYHLGYEIHFIESSINNIKIMREEDLAAFSAMVRE